MIFGNNIRVIFIGYEHRRNQINYYYFIEDI